MQRCCNPSEPDDFYMNRHGALDIRAEWIEALPNGVDGGGGLCQTERTQLDRFWSVLNRAEHVLLSASENAPSLHLERTTSTSSIDSSSELENAAFHIPRALRDLL